MTAFVNNLRWSLVARGWSPEDLATRMPSSWSFSLSSRTDKVRRFQRGDQEAKLHDVELFAEALDVPPAVLAFGCLREWRASE